MSFQVKILIKIFTAIILILAFVVYLAYIFINVQGKALFTDKLENMLGKKVNIGSLRLKPSLDLEIKNLRIKELADVDYIYASPSLMGFLGGRIVFNKVKVLRPRIQWERNLPPVEILGGKAVNNIEEALAQTKEVLESNQAEYKKLPRMIIKCLRVEEGVVNFIDRVISEPSMQITLNEVSFNLDNLYLIPKSKNANFQLNAKIFWHKDSNQGVVFVSGWIDLYKKDMQAKLEIDGIDGVYLHPYYSKWVDLENSRIEQARLNFASDIQGEDNQILARCRLELTDIKFKPRLPEQTEHKAEKITTTVLGIFRALNQGRVVLNFTLKTTMDKPEFKFDSINQAVDETIAQAVKEDKVKLEDIASLPARLLEGVAKGATGATKAIINGAVSMGNSLKDAIMDALKTEEETEEESEGTEIPQENLIQD